MRLIILLLLAMGPGLAFAQADPDFIASMQAELDRAFAADSPAEAQKIADAALIRLLGQEAVHGSKADFHLFRGYFLGLLKREEESLAAFQKAARIEPENPEAQLMTGEALMEASKPAEAKPFLEKALALQPENGQIYVYLGFVHEQLREGAKAEAIYAAGLKAAPSHAGLQASLAAYYSGKGEIEKALPLRKAIRDADPEDSAAWWNYAQTLQMANQSDDALREFLDYRKRFPNDDEALEKICQLAEAAGKTAERDQAREALYQLFRGENPPARFKERPFFIRDTFSVGGLTIYAREYFELRGEQAVKYSLSAYRGGKAESERELFTRISLGSYEATNKIAREHKQLKEGERLFHLDAYPPDGSHVSLGFFNGDPGYAEVKKRVIEVLKFQIEGEKP